jgi:hypothetical protein
MTDIECTECGEEAIDQETHSADLCDTHYHEALMQDAADNAVKYAKENAWGWKA